MNHINFSQIFVSEYLAFSGQFIFLEKWFALDKMYTFNCNCDFSSPLTDKRWWKKEIQEEISPIILFNIFSHFQILEQYKNIATN